MLKNRVLATSGLLFALGVGVAVYLPAFTLYLAVGSLCVLCIYLCAVRIFAFKAKIKRTLLYCVVPIAAVGFTMLYTSVFITPYYALEGRDIKGEAVVGEVRMFGYSGYADVTVTSSDIAVADGMSLRLYLNAEMLLPSYGDTVSFSARLTVPEEPESLFADRTLLVGNDVTLYSFRPTAGVLWRMRSAVSGIIDDIFADSGSGVAPLMKAVVLSDFSSLTEETYAKFRDTGTAHLLAISGQHFSIIIMSIYGILSLIGVSKRTGSISCALLAVVYASFVGFTPSVSRAAIMMIIVFASFFAMREPDGITSLFFALTVLLVANPYSIASASLQLSFLSCLGIILVSPFISSFLSAKNGIIRKIAELIVTPVVYSVVAAVFTFPVTVTMFDTFSIVSPLANLAMTGIFSLMLILALLSIALYPVIGAASAVFYLPSGILCRFIISAADFFASLPSAVISTSVPYMSYALIAALAAVTVLLLFRRALKFAAALGFAAAFYVIIAVGCNAASDFLSENAVIRVKENYSGSQLYLASGVENLLIDFGGKNDLSTLAVENYVRGIDTVIITEPDESAYIRLKALLAGRRVNKIIIPDYEYIYDYTSGPVKNKILELARSKNCDIMYLDDMMMFSVGEAELIYRQTGPYSDTRYIFISAYGRTFLLAHGESSYGSPSDTDILVLSESSSDLDLRADTLLYGENAEDIVDEFVAERKLSYSQSDGFTVLFTEEGDIEVALDEH